MKTAALNEYRKDLKQPNGRRWFCKTCNDNVAKNKRTFLGASDSVHESTPLNASGKEFTLADVMSKLDALEATYFDLLGRYEEQARVNDELKTEIERLKNIVESSSSGPESAPNGSATVAEATISELQERQRRSSHIMVFNMPEQNNDLEEVKTLFGTLTTTPLNIMTVNRYGNRNKNDIRSLRVVLSSSLEAQCVLKNRPKLKKIFIDPDLTKSQRDVDKPIREELKRRQGEKNLAIRYTKGVPKIITKN